jgi:hypothetical protein
MFRNCDPDSMDGDLIKGKIVLCNNDDDSGYSVKDKIDVVKAVGGVGMAVIDDKLNAVATTYGAFPATVISSKDAAEIFSYINSTR